MPLKSKLLSRGGAAIPAAAIGLLLTGTAAADTLNVPFTESFSDGPSNWFNQANTEPLDWVSTGGFDGRGYVTDTYNFVNDGVDDTIVIFRGENINNASDNAFVGDWLDGGVTEFRFAVRHDAPMPINFFTRLASPANFPAAIALEFTPIAPGQWTEIIIPIEEDNPQFISFSGSDFETVFSNIGRIQIGVSVTEGLAGLDQNITLDLDSVSIIPAPGALAVLFAAGALGSRRRRRS